MLGLEEAFDDVRHGQLRLHPAPRPDISQAERLHPDPKHALGQLNSRYARQIDPTEIVYSDLQNKCQALNKKMFRFIRSGNQRYESARLTRQEGRIMIVTNVRWDAVDADVPITNGADAYGEVVWS